MLAARPAFSSPDQLSLLEQIRNTEPTPLRQIDGRIPIDLETVITRATHKEPGRRYETAEQFEADLNRFLDGLPVRARQATTSQRVISWAKRNPVVSGLVSLLVMGLVAAAIGSTYAAFAFRDIANVASESAIQAEEAREQTRQTLARSNYLLAWSRWEENQAEAANGLLDQIPEEHRNIEWTIARHHFRGGKKTIKRAGKDRINAVAVAMQGTTVVAGGEAEQLEVLDMRTGELKRAIPVDGVIRSLDVSRDSSKAAVALSSNRTQMINLNSGDRIWSSRNKKTEAKAVRFSPDGKTLAIVDDSGRLTLRVASKDKSAWSVQAHLDDANDACFHPAGHYIVTVGGDAAVRFFDAQTGEQLLQRTPAGRRWGVLSSCALSPDGRRLAIGCRNGNILVMDSGESDAGELDAGDSNTDSLPTSERFRTAPVTILRGHRAFVSRVAFLPDGMRLVSSGNDGTIRVWNVDAEEQISVLRGHSVNTTSFATAADGLRVVTCAHDGIKLWDARSIGSELNYHGHHDRVSAVEFSTSGAQVVSTSKSQIRLWNPMTLEEQNRFSIAKGQSTYATYAPGSGHVVVSNDEGRIEVWGPDSTEQTGFYDRGQDTIRRMAFSPDGNLIAIADEAQVRLLDSTRMTMTPEPRDAGTEEPRSHPAERFCFTGFDREVRSVAFAPHIPIIAAGGRDGELLLWNTSSGDQVCSIQSGERNVNELRFSNDGERLFSVGEQIKIWDPSTGKLIAKIKGPGSVLHSFDITHDGSRIVSGGSDRTIRIWDVDTGEQLCVLRLPATITSVRFSPDESILVASHGKGVAVWPLRTEFDSTTAFSMEHFESHADPDWHARQADAARAHQNWFAAVVHRAREVASIGPESMASQTESLPLTDANAVNAAGIELWVAARRLAETDHKSAIYLPEIARNETLVQQGFADEEFPLTAATLPAIDRHFRRRAIDGESLTEFESCEIELLQQALAACANETPELQELARELRITLAMAHYRRGEFAKVITTFDPQADQNPMELTLLSMAHLQMGNRGKAKAARELSRSLQKRQERRKLAEDPEFEKIRKEANRWFRAL